MKKKMEFTYMAFFKEHLTNLVPYDVFLNFKVFFTYKLAKFNLKKTFFALKIKS